MSIHLAFLEGQIDHIEQQIAEIEYPDIQYPRLVPVDTSAAEYVRTIRHYSSDRFGKAERLGQRANDIPLADIQRYQHLVGVEDWAIGYDYTKIELAQAMAVPGTNLTSDKAAAARRIFMETVDDIVLNGEAALGWDSFLNLPTSVQSSGAAHVTRVDAAGADAASRLWSAKTADEISKDINDAIQGIWDSSRTVELADTVALPASAVSILANKRVPDTMNTVWDYVRDHNIYTMMTGQPLRFVLCRGLEDAGTSNVGRMIAYRFSPEVLKLHMPMPHRFEPPQQWLYRFIVAGMFRLGGLEVRRPGAIRYVDGITT